MTQATIAASDASTHHHIDPQVRSFLADLSKDTSPFWTLPGAQMWRQSSLIIRRSQKQCSQLRSSKLRRGDMGGQAW
jgi:hypothetical protein